MHADERSASLRSWLRDACQLPDDHRCRPGRCRRAGDQSRSVRREPGVTFAAPLSRGSARKRENGSGSFQNKVKTEEKIMGFEQYHEPAAELSGETRTFARMIVSLGEEAEAINWYEQAISLEKDKSARAIMQNAQKEEFKHFSMDLEWLFRAKPEWKEIAQGILFKKGDIVEHGEEAEEEAD